MKGKRLLLAITCIVSLLGVAWLAFGKRPARRGFDRTKNVLPVETQRVLEHAEKFVLLAIDPLPPFARNSATPAPKEVFHDYGVLGQAELKDKSQREALLKALYKGIADSDGTVAACFNPRHGISATLGDERVDLLICFECYSLQSFGNQAKSAVTTRSPQNEFNRTFEKAGLAVPR